MNVIDTPAALKSLREEKGLTLDAAHQQLRLHKRQIEALEAGQWEQLPGPAFVKASLRSYGKWLQADVMPLINSLSNTAEPELRAATSLDQPMSGQSMLGFGNGGSGYRWAWGLLAILGVVVIALYFSPGSPVGNQSSWLSKSPAGSTANPVAQGAAAPAATPPPANDSGTTTGAGSGTVTTSVPLSLGGTATDSTASQPPVAPGLPVTETQPAPPPASIAPAGNASSSAAALTNPLVLVFNVESWVEVKQADGKVLLYGTQKPGTSSSLDSVGEVQLTIGNAHKVELSYQGKPVGLSPAPGTGIARLTLKP